MQVPCDLREELGYVLLSNELPRITLAAPGARVVRLPYPDLSAQPALALAPCPSASARMVPGATSLRCGAFAEDAEDGDLSTRISVEQLHACGSSASMPVAGAPPAPDEGCVFCSVESLDAGLCPAGHTFVYRYAVLDADSNVAEVEREVVAEGVEVWVATSVIFRNPRRGALRMYAAYEAQVWREAEWPDAVSSRARAAQAAVGGMLGGRFLPQDVRVEDAEAVIFQGEWAVNVTLTVAVTGRHALPWYEADAYMTDLRASIRGGSADNFASATAAGSARALLGDLAVAQKRSSIGGDAGRWWEERGVVTGGVVVTGGAGRDLLQDVGVPLRLYPAVAAVEVRPACASYKMSVLSACMY